MANSRAVVPVISAHRSAMAHSPSPFAAVGQWYGEFPQGSDERVVQLLAHQRGEQEGTHLAVEAVETLHAPLIESIYEGGGVEVAH